ncbi:unnamed protein product [Nezara viridula]|uniref:Uncharacterized protein n=1 Tax=Nezara viridula TaxID=85310 RepID=A0A9P0HAR2_NEZVI|nr:unnamed protein product [Nezara viridula]
MAHIKEFTHREYRQSSNTEEVIFCEINLLEPEAPNPLLLICRTPKRLPFDSSKRHPNRQCTPQQFISSAANDPKGTIRPATETDTEISRIIYQWIIQISGEWIGLVIASL